MGNQFDLYFGNTSRLLQQSRRFAPVGAVSEQQWTEGSELGDGTVQLDETVLYQFREDLAFFISSGPLFAHVRELAGMIFLMGYRYVAYDPWRESVGQVHASEDPTCRTGCNSY